MTEGQRKLKLLYLMRILEEDTDPEHGITMPQLIDRLTRLGIPCERKSLYRDIQTLRGYGIDIKTYHRSPLEYAVDERDFSMSELTMLSDAIQSSQFITERKARSLVTKLKSLTSSHKRDLLDRRIYVEGRLRNQLDCVFSAIDTIHKAMEQGMRITFRYLDYNTQGERVLRKDGKVYEETPVAIMINNNHYYVVTFNSDHEKLLRYRLDRMEKLNVSDLAAAEHELIQDFSLIDFERRSFSMFDGDTKLVRLRVQANQMNAVFDKFSREVNIVESTDEYAIIENEVAESPTFYAWLSQFKGEILLEGPADVKANYLNWLTKLLEDNSKD